MNKIYLVLAGAVSLLMLTNCGKKDEKSPSVEMSAACYYQQTQSGQSCGFNYQGVNGFGPAYVYSSWGGGGSVSCNGGAPVYSPSKGLGCVVNDYISYNGSPAVYTLNQQTGQFTLTASNYSFGGSSQVYRTCNDSDDKCPSDFACRSPFGNMASSSLGICYRK